MEISRECNESDGIGFLRGIPVDLVHRKGIIILITVGTILYPRPFSEVLGLLFYCPGSTSS